MAKEYAKQTKMLLYETSAKEGKGIDDVFIGVSNELAAQSGSHTTPQEPEKTTNITLSAKVELTWR